MSEGRTSSEGLAGVRLWVSIRPPLILSWLEGVTHCFLCDVFWLRWEKKQGHTIGRGHAGRSELFSHMEMGVQVFISTHLTWRQCSRLWRLAGEGLPFPSGSAVRVEPRLSLEQFLRVYNCWLSFLSRPWHFWHFKYREQTVLLELLWACLPISLCWRFFQ